MPRNRLSLPLSLRHLTYRYLNYSSLDRDCMLSETQASPFINGLYEKLIEGGLSYFFPSAKLELLGRDPGSAQELLILDDDHTSLTMNCLGVRCSLRRDEPFSDAEQRLISSIGAVLVARYRMILDADRVEQRFELFRAHAPTTQKQIKKFTIRGKISGRLPPKGPTLVEIQRVNFLSHRRSPRL